MTDYWLRRQRPDDGDEIAALNDFAFAGKSESAILHRLASDGDSLLSLVAHDDRRIAGHVQFFRILVDGAPVAAGLGPMCVAPDVQRSGIGSQMVRMGLIALEGSGERLVFVLGHKDYYPRFGFSSAAAEAFRAPWSGPSFMARHIVEGGPEGGVLTYPAAFGAP